MTLRIGDIVKLRGGKPKHTKVGIVVTLDEPTVAFPFQLAQVVYTDGTREKLVTSVLQKIGENPHYSLDNPSSICHTSSKP